MLTLKGGESLSVQTYTDDYIVNLILDAGQVYIYITGKLVLLGH